MKKSRSLLSVIVASLMMFVLLIGVSAANTTVNVSYIDADGTEKTVNATPVNANTTELTGGWYVVNENITIAGAIEIKGDSHLIIEDGKTLAVTGGKKFDYEYAGIYSYEHSLSVYGQTNQTGILSVAVKPAFNSLSDCSWLEAVLLEDHDTNSCFVINGARINLFAEVDYGDDTLDEITAEESPKVRGISCGNLTVNNGKLDIDVSGCFVYGISIASGLFSLNGGEINCDAVSFDGDFTGSAKGVSAGRIAVNGGCANITASGANYANIGTELTTYIEPNLRFDCNGTFTATGGEYISKALTAGSWKSTGYTHTASNKGSLIKISGAAHVVFSGLDGAAVIGIAGFNGTPDITVTPMLRGTKADGSDATVFTDTSTLAADFATYKYMEFGKAKNAHEHAFTYTADGAKLTAACSAEGCENATQTVTLTAETNPVYDGKAHGVTLEGSIEGVALTDVKYYSGTTELGEAPVNAGTYTAKLTKGNATAVVEYTIAKSKELKLVKESYTGPEVSGVQKVSFTYNGELQTMFCVCCNISTGITLTVSTNGGQPVNVPPRSGVCVSGTEAVQKTVRIRAEGSNYEPAEFTVIFEISPAILNVSGTTVSSKTYDGTDCGVAANAGQLSGVIVGDDVYIETVTATFADAEAGENKAVSVAYTLGGQDAGNYTVNASTVSAAINKADMTANVTATDVTYEAFKANVELSGVNTTDFDGAKLQYAVSTESAPASLAWQDDAAFTALKSETDYYLFVKVTEVDNYNDFTSTGVKVTTASFKALLDEYIDEKVEVLEEKLPEDINEIIVNAIGGLEAFEPDTEKSLEENKETVDNVVEKAIADIKATKIKAFEDYKEQVINELKNSGLTEEEIEERTNEISALQYDETKSMQENIEAIDSIAYAKSASSGSAGLLAMIFAFIALIVAFMGFLAPVTLK